MKYLMVKISDMAAYRPQNNIYGYYDLLLELRSRIYQHPGEKWSVSVLCRQANLSPSHFQRLYKEAFGITCIADVIACKTEYAKASLAGTGETIREISALCGRNLEEYFMRQFKKLVGVTPSQYRAQVTK
jgi:AraC family transcriptional regulator of arabinose operon